jgi:hypothetical protein
MAARRLIAVLIVLLIVATLFAALAPGPNPGSTSSTTTEHRPSPTGGVVRARFAVRSGPPHAISVAVGDELRLTVASRQADQVQVLGEVASVDRFAPATFDLLITRPGTFAVRLLEARRTVAEIHASPRGRASNKRPGKRRG